MADAPQLIYWDSCVIIAYLNEDSNYDLKVLDAIVDEVGESNGKIKIVSSVFSKVEVVFDATEKTNNRLSPDAEKKIDDFWKDDSVLEVVEFHDGIVKLARTLIRESIPNGWRVLEKGDAIHLATAKWVGVSEFHTYDLSHLARYEQTIGFKICEPYTEQPRLVDAPKGKPRPK
jgi:predicted nucleic acid-binding protein